MLKPKGKQILNGIGINMITVDRREAKEAEEHHNIFIPDALDLPCAIDTLEAADYAFLDRDSAPFGIERSEIGNLVQKLRSGELEEQMYKCQANYASVILLIEGVYDQVDRLLAVHKDSNRGYFRTHIYPHTYYDYVKATEVRLSEMGIEIIHSPNFQCSMSVIRTIYNQRTKPEEEHTLFKRVRAIKIPVKLTSNPAVPMLMALCPRLPEKTAIRLINKYDSIWNILSTPDDELLGVEGMGKGLLDKLKRGVGKE